MKMRLLTVILIFLVTGCHNVPVYKYGIFERPVGNKEYPKNYIKGWQHGCESGAEASANYVYRLKYKFKQDWKMLYDANYKSGWDDSYNFCRKYVLQHNLRALN